MCLGPPPGLSGSLATLFFESIFPDAFTMGLDFHWLHLWGGMDTASLPELLAIAWPLISPWAWEKLWVSAFGIRFVHLDFAPPLLARIPSSSALNGLNEACGWAGVLLRRVGNISHVFWLVQLLHN